MSPSFPILFLFLFCLFHQFSLSDNIGLTDLAQKGVDAIDTAVKFTNYFIALVGKDGLDISDLSNLVSSLGHVVGVLGPIGGVVGELIKLYAKTNDAAELKKQFGLLHEHMNEIESKLGHLSDKIGVEIVFAQYESTVTKPLIAVRALGERYLLNAESATLADFRNQCSQSHSATIIEWIDYLVNKDNKGAQLFESFFTASKHNRRQLRNYVFSVLADLFQLGYWDQMCGHVQAIPRTQAVSDALAKKIEKLAGKIVEKLFQLNARLMAEWPKVAETEIKDLLKKEQQEDKNNKRSNSSAIIFEHLSNKYHFNLFQVHVFEWKKGANYAFGKVYRKTNLTGFIEAHRENYRTAVVAWTRKPDDSNDKRMLQDFVKKAGNFMISFEDESDGCTSTSDRMIDNMEHMHGYGELKPAWMYTFYDPKGRKNSQYGDKDHIFSRPSCKQWMGVRRDYAEQVLIGY